MAASDHQQQLQHTPHFVIVCFPAQGHINPTSQLARLLVRRTGARVTFCTAVSAHRKMFPSATAGTTPAVVGHISYIPYSDGYDDGFNIKVHDPNDYLSQIAVMGSKTLADILCRLNGADGPPVTCVIYSILLSWVPDVARQQNIPSALYWIQPATVFLAYHHYYHGNEAVIAAVAHDPYASVDIPGLPELKIRDLPSFLTVTSPEHKHYAQLSLFRQMFDSLDDEAKSGGGQHRPTVIFNTFDELEADALRVIHSTFNPVTIGPVISLFHYQADDQSAQTASTDLFQTDHKPYMSWLEEQELRSVVYVSFGSTSEMSRRQIEEIVRGLKASKRVFLMVVRKENKVNVGDGVAQQLEPDEREGMVVEWCNQVQVLSHPAVGCFVTHGGWNSTLESLSCGVPVVTVPQWSDQPTNAWIMESLAKTGVRGKVDDDGVLGAEELRRCLELVMAESVHDAAEEWKAKAVASVTAGGSSDRKLRAFIDELVGGAK